MLEPFTADEQIDRTIEAAKHALASLDDRADFVPNEVSELRREVRELRKTQAELKDSLDELKGKVKADKPSSGGSASGANSSDAKATDASEDDDADEK